MPRFFRSYAFDRAAARDAEREPLHIHRADEQRRSLARRRAQQARLADIMCGAITCDDEKAVR